MVNFQIILCWAITSLLLLPLKISVLLWTWLSFHLYIRSIVNKASGLYTNFLQSIYCRSANFVLILLKTLIHLLFKYFYVFSSLDLSVIFIYWSLFNENRPDINELEYLRTSDYSWFIFSWGQATSGRSLEVIEDFFTIIVASVQMIYLKWLLL